MTNRLATRLAVLVVTTGVGLVAAVTLTAPPADSEPVRATRPDAEPPAVHHRAAPAGVETHDGAHAPHHETP